VREVRVHLEHEPRAAAQRVVEPGEVRRPEPLRRRAVQDLDLVELRRQPVGDLAGPVRRVVVHDQHAMALAARALQDGQHGADDALDVVGLVVRGQDQPGGPHGGDVP
jgi:hypothetical protein